MAHVCTNGRFIAEELPLFTARNRGFRYGEGLFETMRAREGRVPFFRLHWQRLQAGMQLLGMPAGPFDAERIGAEIAELCRLNGCTSGARIRWAVYRQEDDRTGYVLEAEALEQPGFQWHQHGWSLDLYTANAKAPGPLSNLKSANYLLYLLAAADAKESGIDECLVLNTAGNLCDGSRTNVFVVKRGALHTPALNQGCVAGVMRRYLLETCAAAGTPILEEKLTEANLLQADEVFLTNAVQGIRWVRFFKKKEYGCTISRRLFEQLATAGYP